MIRFHDLERMKTMKVTLRIERCWRYSKVQRRPSVDGQGGWIQISSDRAASPATNQCRWQGGCIQIYSDRAAFGYILLLYPPWAFCWLDSIYRGSHGGCSTNKQEPADNAGRDGLRMFCAIFGSWLKKHVKSRPPCPNAVLIDGIYLDILKTRLKDVESLVS